MLYTHTHTHTVLIILHQILSEQKTEKKKKNWCKKIRKNSTKKWTLAVNFVMWLQKLLIKLCERRRVFAGQIWNLPSLTIDFFLWEQNEIMAIKTKPPNKKATTPAPAADMGHTKTIFLVWLSWKIDFYAERRKKLIWMRAKKCSRAYQKRILLILMAFDR